MSQQGSCAWRSSNLVLALATILAVCTALPTRGDTIANWNSEVSSGWESTVNWSVAPNFPKNGLPAGTNYQAIIDAKGGILYTVTLNNTIALDSLTINSPDAYLNQTAATFSPGTLNVTAGTYAIQGGTLSNASTTIGTSGTMYLLGTISGGTVNNLGGSFRMEGGTLDGTPTGGITLMGKVDDIFDQAASLKGLINDPNGFVFNNVAITLLSDTELRGNGSTTTIPNFIVGAGNGGQRLTVDAGHTLLSQSSFSSTIPLALTNNGTVQADGANLPVNLSLSNASQLNAGTIKATNGASMTLALISGGTFANSGTMLADGLGSFLAINGNGFANIGSGTIRAINGGTVELQNGNFVNNGLATADAASTLSIGNGAVLDNTGTPPGSSSILRPSPGGTLQLSNGGTIRGGTLDSTGGTLLNAYSYAPFGVHVTLDGTPTGGITLIGTLRHAQSYDPLGVTTNLQGLIIDPSGFTFDASLDSLHTANGYNIGLTGNTELKGNGSTTTIANAGSDVTLGDVNAPETLTIDNGHTLLNHAAFLDVTTTIVNNGTIRSEWSNAIILDTRSSNSGTMEAINGGIITIVDYLLTFKNSGTLRAASGGTLELPSSFNNTGMITLKNGIINAPSGLAIGDGTLLGSGTINGDVVLASDPSTLAFQIRGDSDFDQLTISGNMTLSGNLQISLAPGTASSLIPGDTFVLLDATTLTGSFLNVANDGRLLSADGSGSFLVNYGSGDNADQIVLSDFQSIPEPGSLLLFGMGTLGIFARGRRSKFRRSTISDMVYQYPSGGKDNWK